MSLPSIFLQAIGPLETQKVSLERHIVSQYALLWENGAQLRHRWCDARANTRDLLLEIISRLPAATATHRSKLTGRVDGLDLAFQVLAFGHQRLPVFRRLRLLVLTLIALGSAVADRRRRTCYEKEQDTVDKEGDWEMVVDKLLQGPPGLAVEAVGACGVGLRAEIQRAM